jgi:hypothetical protein
MKRARAKAKQYTIRNIPPAVDLALRKQARANGKSLNDTALEALCRAAGIETPTRFHDIDHIIGTWEEDPEFDRILAAQRTIDEDLWR